MSNPYVWTVSIIYWEVPVWFFACILRVPKLLELLGIVRAIRKLCTLRRLGVR